MDPDLENRQRYPQASFDLHEATLGRVRLVAVRDVEYAEALLAEIAPLLAGSGIRAVQAPDD